MKKVLFAIVALIGLTAAAFAQGFPPCPGGQWRVAGINYTGAPDYVCDLPPRYVGGPPPAYYAPPPPPAYRPAYGGHHGPTFHTAPVGRPVTAGHPCGLTDRQGWPYC